MDDRPVKKNNRLIIIIFIVLHDNLTYLVLLHFFCRIPEEKCLKDKWIHAIRRENWTPSSSSRLCSAHFLSTDYQVRPGASSFRLKDDAVPSIFPAYPRHLQVSDNLIN